MDNSNILNQIQGVNDMGKFFDEVDDDARRLLKANMDGLITGFRMGLEHKGENHGIQTDLHS